MYGRIKVDSCCSIDGKDWRRIMTDNSIMHDS